MAEVIVINPTKSVVGNVGKIRVGAYIRVSSNSDDQENSYMVQYDYYSKLIAANPDWVFVDIYADEHVIIGTSGENLVKSRVSALVPFLFYIKGSHAEEIIKSHDVNSVNFTSLDDIFEEETAVYKPVTSIKTAKFSRYFEGVSDSGFIEETIEKALEIYFEHMREQARDEDEYTQCGEIE